MIEVEETEYGKWKRLRHGRWAVRTIRDGRVKLFGVTFEPSDMHMKYDGRLDGKRYLFKQYSPSFSHRLMASMWGSEERYRTALSGDENWHLLDRPEVVDEKHPWSTWFAVEATK